MSKSNNLTDFLTDIASAIRSKKGTSAKINPQNFSFEISDMVPIPNSVLAYFKSDSGFTISMIDNDRASSIIVLYEIFSVDGPEDISYVIDTGESVTRPSGIVFARIAVDTLARSSSAIIEFRNTNKFLAGIIGQDVDSSDDNYLCLVGINNTYYVWQQIFH